jgi:integrase
MSAWIRRSILHHRKKHPAAMGAVEVNAFLSHLAVALNVSASTEAQALSALVFLANLLVVREGNGNKDRRTMLPESLRPALQAQITEVRRLHARDLAQGLGDVWLPDALDRKYPGAGRETAWQYVFPATRISFDPRAGVRRRHHLEESVVQRAVKAAVRAAHIEKHAGCHTLRHCAASPVMPKPVAFHVCFRVGGSA